MAITDSEAQDLLDRARTALQQGDKTTARDLLIRLLEQDDRNARAWLLLSGAVDAVEEQRICLENVLTLEPGNNAARQGLEYLNKLHPQSAGGQPTTTPSIAPAAPPAPPPAPAVAAKPPQQQPQSSQTFTPTQTPQPFTPIAADDAIPTFVPAAPYSNGFDDLNNFPGIEPFMPPGFEPSSADSGQSAASAGWPQPPEVVETQSDWPTTRIGPGNFDIGAAPLAAPDDPWAELRANMQPQNSNGNGGLPSWAPGSEANTPAPSFGSETPPSWDSVTPSASNNHFGEAGMSDFPSDVQPFQYDSPGSDSMLGSADMTSLPDWAVSIDTASSGGSSGESSGLPSWALPSTNGAVPDMALSPNGAAPSAGPNPAGPSLSTFPPISEPRSTPSLFSSPAAPASGSFGSSPFGLSAPSELDNSAALNGTELPPDSPWAGTFGGGLGLGAMSSLADSANGQQNMGDMSAANFQFGSEDPGGSSPSLISRPPISNRAAHIATGFSCPNCGEVAFGNALSCARCQFRFYAACPNCGEFLDTTDPDPGGDSCPKCGRAIDKLELGRNELPGKRPVTTREAIIAQIPTTRPASELAASQAIRQAQTQSHTRTLIGLLVVIALLVFLFYFLPGLLENSGINLVDSTLNIGISTPTP